MASVSVRLDKELFDAASVQFCSLNSQKTLTPLQSILHDGGSASRLVLTVLVLIDQIYSR